MCILTEILILGNYIRVSLPIFKVCVYVFIYTHYMCIYLSFYFMKYKYETFHLKSFMWFLIPTCFGCSLYLNDPVHTEYGPGGETQSIQKSLEIFYTESMSHVPCQENNSIWSRKMNSSIRNRTKDKAPFLSVVIHLEKCQGVTTFR